MPEAYVIDAVRSAVGKRNGSLSGVHPVDLGAAAWRGLFDRVDVDPGSERLLLGLCDHLVQDPRLLRHRRHWNRIDRRARGRGRVRLDFRIC